MDDDPRTTPARGDIAAKYLEGKIKAARFVTGEEFEIAQALAPLRRAPSSDAELMTQALKGERVTIYDRNGEGWAWGQLASDGYVGWLPDGALKKPITPPTHKVTALRTFAFPGPSIKLPPVETLVMGSLLAVLREEGSFAVTREGWYLPRPHLGSLDSRAPDFVTVAEQFTEHDGVRRPIRRRDHLEGKLTAVGQDAVIDCSRSTGLTIRKRTADLIEVLIDAADAGVVGSALQ